MRAKLFPGTVCEPRGHVEHVDAPALAAAVSRLLTTPTELAALAGAAQARTFRTWRDYARDVATWLPTLSRRP